MAAIDCDADRRVWLLHTASTSYALALTGQDAPRHVHWGAPLTLAQVLSVVEPDRVPANSFDGPDDGLEELSADGGTRYGPPSLQVRFADGTGAFEWSFLGHEIVEGAGEALLRLDFEDRFYPLKVSLSYRVMDGTDVIERWTTVTNSADGNDDVVEVTRLDSASWSLPGLPGYRLTGTTGWWGAETQLRRGEIARGETVLTSRRGVTGHHANPSVMIDAGDAGEEQGEVWSAALAWSGSWRITAARTSSDQVSVTGGFGHDGVRWRLRPGETLETPVFAGLYHANGFGGSSRLWHAYALGRVLPHRDEVRPVLYNSWEATAFDVGEEQQRALAVRAAELGVEMFVMDDGWFGRRTSDRAGLGDWQVNRDRFRDGLKPLVDQVHRLGMKFGLWVEPEMVNPDSDLYREHPDWVLHHPHRRRSELRNQLVLNFARPDVAEWALQWLRELVGEHGIDFLKWDMNRAFSEAGWPSNTEDPDRLWIGHTRAVYRIMDSLRAEYPGLRIESCCGGGGRVDFGVLARTDQVWTSDNTDAHDRLGIQHGYSQFYPPRAMAAWVTDNPNFLTGRTVPLPFRFHVAMCGVLGIGGDIGEWAVEERAYARGRIQFYKEIRDVVQFGRLYRLSPPSAELTALSYLSPEGDRAVVFGFRSAGHYGRADAAVRLAGLDPAAEYVDEDTRATHHGAVLLSRGLCLDLPAGDYASAVVRLRRV
jgi:alpha-galactosidase